MKQYTESYYKIKLQYLDRIIALSRPSGVSCIQMPIQNQFGYLEKTKTIVFNKLLLSSYISS